MADEKIEMTKEEYAELDKRYRHLLDVERPAIIEALQAARAQGDLSENADYDAARNRQAEIEAEITHIEGIKDHIVIVESRGDKINVGFTVDYVETATGKAMKVKMVSTVLANPLANPPAISQESAVGKALLGHVAGDVVTVEAPKKKYDIKIVAIQA